MEFCQSKKVGTLNKYISGACGCNLDRHENIGRGKLGTKTFRRVMNDDRLNFLPFILETPSGDYAREIKTLYRLCE